MASTAGIASLLDTHKEEVARLLAVTAPERSIARGAELLAAKQMNISDAPMTIYDELFVLRFLLSHPTNPLPSLRSSLQFRAAHAPGLLLRRLSKAPPHHDLIQPFCIQENHGHAKDGSPLFIVRSGLTNLSPLMDHSSPEMVGEWMLYLREADFHDCDSKSREKGRITKMLSVIDFNHSSLSNSLNREFFKALGMSSKWSEGYYPQLLSSTIVSNPPFFLTAMMAIGRPLMSKKTLEKMKICPAETSPGQLGRCPYASISFGETELPTFLGGSCTCEDKGRTGCIQNVPNTADKPPNPTLDLVKAAARFAADVDGKASGTGNWRGQTITWTSVSLASKESKTIELGTLDPGVYPDGHPDTAKGGALTFLAYLPQPTARSSGAHVTFHAANPVFVDRRVKIHDTSRTWVETAHAVKLSVKVDNKDKAAKEVRIGFGWISGAEMAVISGA